MSNVIRALDTPAGDNVFAVLYTPEVFGTLGAAATAGVYPNSLAAVSELLNGHWWHGSEDNSLGLVSPRENAVLRRAGLPAPQARNGPRFPFLVGRVGTKGVDFGSPDRLFEMTARSLASWATPTAENSGFVQYTIGNWNTLAKDGRHQQGVLVDEGGSHEQGLPPMSALGFSRLSVGAGYLQEYAVQRITRDVLRHLARYHSESPDAESVRARLETDDPDAVMVELAERAMPTFLRQARLTERGPEDNVIQTDIEPPGAADLQSRLEAEARELADIDGDDQMTSEQWASRIRQAVAQAQEQYEKQYRSDLESSTLEWIERSGDLAVAAAAESVAVRGLAVTAEMVSRAKALLESDVYDELLNTDVPAFRKWAADAPAAISDKLGPGSKKMRADHTAVEDVLLEGVYYAGFSGKAMTAERAAYVVQDFAERVLGPLYKQLAAALSLAEMDLTQTDTWVEWSSDRPPDSVRPPVGDYPLLDPDDYPALFDELTAGDIGTSTLVLDQRTELRRQVVLGSFGVSSDSDSSKEQTCIQTTRSWFPQATVALGGSRAPSDIGVSVRTEVSSLRERTERWLRREGSRWHRYLGMTIRQYVGSDDPADPLRPDEDVLRWRHARFNAQFSTAVAAAAPFISLDAGLMGPIHLSRPTCRSARSRWDPIPWSLTCGPGSRTTASMTGRSPAC